VNVFKKFIFSSFIRPFLLTFSVVILILLMQFLWKYVDDLIGKGLEINVIIELLWYSTITLIPIALPLSILLASMMLIGGMSERLEITAINTLGQPFTYIIKPLFLFSFLITILSFIISNYTIPYANLKTTNLMYDIMQKKLNINIKEKVFFSEIDGYSIRVNEKTSDGKMKDVMIYDYTDKSGVKKVFNANYATISTTKDNNYLIINLYDGEVYNEMSKEEEEYILKTKFKEYILALDLSSFQMERTTADRFSNKAKTLNSIQLKKGIDSLYKEIIILEKNMLDQINSITPKKTTINQSQTSEKLILNLNKKIRDITSFKNQRKLIIKKLNKFEVELHRKFTLAIACVIMFMIGAPVGAIIKKGGFGLPVIFSIILFLLYHVISITGEKMVKKDLVDPSLGMWCSTYIMFIIGIILILIVNDNRLIKKNG